MSTAFIVAGVVVIVALAAVLLIRQTRKMKVAAATAARVRKNTLSKRRELLDAVESESLAAAQQLIEEWEYKQTEHGRDYYPEYRRQADFVMGDQALEKRFYSVWTTANDLVAYSKFALNCSKHLAAWIEQRDKANELKTLTSLVGYLFRNGDSTQRERFASENELDLKHMCQRLSELVKTDSKESVSRISDEASLRKYIKVQKSRDQLLGSHRNAFSTGVELQYWPSDWNELVDEYVLVPDHDEYRELPELSAEHVALAGATALNERDATQAKRVLWYTRSSDVTKQIVGQPMIDALRSLLALKEPRRV